MLVTLTAFFALSSLAGSALHADEVTIEVSVLDADGRPCAGQTVYLVEAMRRVEGMPDDFGFSHTLAEARTDSESGVARFEDAAKLVRNAEHMDYFVKLAIPPVSEFEHQVEVDPLESQEIVLRKPPTGAVLFRVDEYVEGSLRLREKQGEGTEWPFQPLCVEEVTDRTARFEVGLNVELEFELRLSDGRRESGVLVGPVRPDQVVKHRISVDAPESFPSFTGRLVDERRRPVADASVSFNVTISEPGSSRGAGQGRFVTGPAGEFEVRVTAAARPGGSRRLRFYRMAEASTVRYEPADSRTVDVSRDFGPGLHDLGEIVLLTPSASVYLANLGDDELKAFYQDLSEMDYSGFRHREAALLEMGHRGARLAEFLQSQFDAHQGPAYLTALRRAQGKRDPLRIEMEEESVLATVFPESPVLLCRIVNVDEEGASVRVADGGSYRSGRFGRVRWEGTARDPEYTTLPAPGMMGGGLQSERLLQPGDSLQFGMKLDSYVRFHAPGTHEGRVLYHDDHTIADDADVEGWAVLRSDPVQVQIDPMTVRSTPEAQERIKQWIADLELEDPIVLVGKPWSPDLEFEGDPETSRDRLYRTGYEAVPALIDSLEEDVEPRVLANRIALLWNITGYIHPSQGGPFGALGSCTWTQKWPTALGRGGGGLGNMGKSTGAINREGLGKLMQAWLLARGWIRLEVD